jgi:GDP-L-fucose synthase
MESPIAYRQQYGSQCVFLIPTNFCGAPDNFEPKTSYVIASLLGKFVQAVETGVTEIGIGGRGCATRDFIRVEDGSAHEESCNRKKTACAQGV